MNIKRFLVGALLAFSASCAGGEGFEEQELGTLEQNITVKTSPARQWGVMMNSPGSRGYRCDRTNANQTCYYVKSAAPFAIENPVFKFYINTSFTEAERTLLGNVFTTVGSEIAASFSGHQYGWSIAPTFNFTPCPSDQVIQDTACTNLSIRKIDLAMPGVGQPGYNHIGAYVDLDPFQGCVTAQKGNTMSGTFKSCLQGTGGIDLGNINARGANATEDAQLLKHAVGNLIMQLIGFGNNADTSGTPSSYGHTQITPFAGRVPNSVGEVCRGNAIDSDNGGNVINRFNVDCTKN